MKKAEKVNLPVREGDTVFIAGVPFGIEQTSGNIIPYDGSVMGLIETMEQQITLSTMPGLEMQQHVFLHEVIHGIVEGYHIPMPSELKQEEAIVDSIARGLYQVMVENPDIFLRYIFGIEIKEKEDAAE